MDNTSLDKKIQNVAWALFLIILGCLWLIPKDKLPSGTWLIAVGIILLGLNIARYLYKIKTSHFTIIAGIIAIALGISDYIGFDLPLFPLVIIIIGISMLLDVRKDKSE